MSLSGPDRQALDGIEDGLAGSDPGLASMLNTFSRVTSAVAMPAHEKIRGRGKRLPGRSPRLTRRRPRRGIALPLARLVPARPAWPPAMLALWFVISAGLLAVALTLNASGHEGCIPSVASACPSSAFVAHAGGLDPLAPPASRPG